MNHKKLICIISISTIVLVFGFISLLYIPSRNPSQAVVLNTVSMFGEDDPSSVAYKQLISEFETKNKNIMISDNSESSSEEWKNKTVEQFHQIETTPDVIFYFTGADARQLILDDNFVSLEEINEIYTDYGKNIRPSTMNFMKEFDGNYYCIPARGFWEGLFCNKELFDKYQLKLPTNWDSFITAVDVFQQNGVVPIAASLSEIPHYWIEHLIMAEGGYIEHRLNPLGYVPDSWIKGMDRLTQLYQMSAFPKNTFSITNSQANQMFTDKKAAMSLEGSWLISSIKYPEQTVVLPFPNTSSGKKESTDIISGYSSGFYVTRKAWNDLDKRDAAIKFVMHMTSNEGITQLCKAGGAPAADIAIIGTPTLLQIYESRLQNDALHVNMPIDSHLYKEAWQYLCSAIEPLVNGKVTSFEVINNVSTKNKW